jgi:serine/threonine-protein kinase
MERLQYGRYETLGLIASGGMASVYLGRARGPAGFERLVAIKVMHEHIAGDPEFSSMFLDEARLAARIRHPNVVPTIDVSEDGRIIVMEYVEGASLSAILRHLRAQDAAVLELPVTLRIVLDVLDGVHAAHELRDKDGTAVHLVHRDISPHNVLCGIDGISRITDFGIAYAESRLTSTRDGMLKGKMPYMAPEQLQGKEVDRRVDVYAAGCVLWELLTGQRLFSADNDAALACGILAGPDRTPRQVRFDVPGALDDACMQALLPVDRRFVSAQAFAEALESAANEAGIGVARPRAVAEVAKAAHVSIPLPPSSRMEASASTEAPPGGLDGAGSGPADPGAAAGPPPTTATRTVTAPSADAQLPPAALREVAAVAASPASGRADGRLPATPTGTLRGEDEPPASAPVTAPDLGPAVESARTTSSVISPVLIDRGPRALRWGIALLGAGLLTSLGAWLLLGSTATPTGADRAPSGTAADSAREPSPRPTASGAEDRAADVGGGATAPASARPTAPDSTRTVPSNPAVAGSAASPRGSATAHSTAAAAPGTMAPATAATVGPGPTGPPPPSSTVFHPSKL